MTAAKKKRSLSRRHRIAQDHLLVFQLYIDSTQSSTLRALDNLTTICRDHFNRNYRIEIIDALKDCRRARKNGIRATPTLVKRAPKPIWQIEGDLSEDASILAVMKGHAPRRRLK